LCWYAYDLSQHKISLIIANKPKAKYGFHPAAKLTFAPYKEKK
jgi:hypothetical protein